MPTPYGPGFHVQDHAWRSKSLGAWCDLRLLPGLVVAIFISTACIQAVMRSKWVQRQEFDPQRSQAIRQIGGRDLHILKWTILRLVAAAFFLALSLVTAVASKSWHDAVIAVAAAYEAIVALLAAAQGKSSSRTEPFQTTVTFIAILACYGYRDVWPLLTFTLHPKDGSEGWILWAKVALATIVGIIVPLLEPYPYISSDKTEITGQPNPEQTASLFSFLLFTYLDPTVAKAYRVPHLQASELPPLCDYDSTKSLIASSYPELDSFSGAKCSLVWGLLKVFRMPILWQAVVLTIEAAAKLASPIGTNRLLHFLESEGEDAVVRPWAWIIWIGLGPVVATLCHELYSFLVTGVLARVEAIITSLVFDQALRVRLQSETAESKSTSDGAPAAEGPKTCNSNFVGKINNLVTSDLANISGGNDFLRLLITTPLTFAFAMGFLYWILGWSSLVGLAVMGALIPVPARVTRSMGSVQREKMNATDARVTVISEVLAALRMIKLFGWEGRAQEDIDKKRNEELNRIWSTKLLILVNNLINFTIPVVHLVVTFAIYTLVMKRELNASIVFSSITGFNMMRNEIHMVFRYLPLTIQAKVSLDRVQEYLSSTELLDCFVHEEIDVPTQIPSSDRHEIGFARATFSWSPSTNAGSTTPTESHFLLRVEDELHFQPGAINLIIGPTGSGKTSLLMALLGEMRYIPLRSDSWFNLPKANGVAYASQESWILNRTIRDNILLNASYDKSRYQQVIHQCALEHDLSLFEFGDMTEVGEKGITLSGGQKARITLARAVYSDAKILLLDDVFAALDVHTSRWVVDKCFKGDLIRGRTVLLVTHNVAIVSPVASYIVDISSDGRARSYDTLDEALARDRQLAEELSREETKSSEKDKVIGDEEKNQTVARNGKLIVDEEIAEGHVGWNTIKLLVVEMGGRRPALFWLSWFIVSLLCEMSMPLQTWWLGWWAQQYQTLPASRVNVLYYLAVYGAVVCSSNVTHAYSVITYTLGAIRASRSIHEQLVSSVVRSTFRWLDQTPTSRIIARCTQDIQAVDETLSQSLNFFLQINLALITNFGAILIITPEYLIPGIAIGAAGLWIGHIFSKAQLSVKREMSMAKSPVIATVSEALAGLVSIRAYGVEGNFKEDILQRIDHYTRISRTFYGLNRWLTVRIDLLSGIFCASLAAYLVYGPTTVSPSNVGFSLSTAMWFCQMVLWCVRLLNDLEVQGNSLERIQNYLEIEHEPEAREGEAPPAYWPASGDLRVETLSARYSPDGPEVLRNVSFHIRSGERIGVVGRTGSGKSSLTLSLLRCIHTSGEIYYDGLPIRSISLDALRLNVTIIPQLPELISGTIRRNLDMFGDHDDAVLNEALRAIGWSSSQIDAEDHKITLDSAVASGGTNFSVGQRQLIAIARAIVRQNKLLILDEATSAIDYETDTAIQAAMRKELKNGVTVITVAHRLQTIMDSDKIMVLDSGCLTEFASPKDLLQDERSLFRALVDESADREDLYALAGAANTRS